MYHWGANLNKMSIDITSFNIGLLKLQAAQQFGNHPPQDCGDPNFKLYKHLDAEHRF